MAPSGPPAFQAALDRWAAGSSHYGVYLGRTQYGHSGGSQFGSSLLLFDPETGITVVVVMNQGVGADHFQLAPELPELATRGS